MNTPLQRRDGARPAVPLNVESRPADGPVDPGWVGPALSDRFFNWLRESRREGSGPREFALFLFIVSIALILFSIWSGNPRSDRQSAPDLNQAASPSDSQLPGGLSAHEKRLASKAAYRARRSADDAFRDSERQRVKEWRGNNRDKTREQKRKARSENYHRAFVAIDSEGQNYPGDAILYDGERYARHDTYLWGAAADDRRPPSWLAARRWTGGTRR